MSQNTALIRQSNMQISSMDDLKTVGEVFARSGFFKDAQDMSKAIVKIMAGAELGFGPVASMTGIYIVKERVTLSANLIGAAIKRSGRYNYKVIQHTDQACEIEFFEQGQSIGKSVFTMNDARKAGLAEGQTWTKFPRNMLFARALSNGAKWHCADVFGGPVYTPDELGADVAMTEDGEMTVINEPHAPARVLQLPPPNRSQQLKPQHLQKRKPFTTISNCSFSSLRLSGIPLSLPGQTVKRASSSISRQSPKITIGNANRWQFAAQTN